MPAFNVVKFRVKPGQDAAFLDAHRDGKASWPGLVRGVMIKTGDRAYCLIGEWNDTSAIADARSEMIETLNSFRPSLEDLGAGIGVTDAISGSVVLTI
jgi:hypothetical protein